jgi:hypothetical protein
MTNTAQAIPISSASWSVTDGTKTAVYSASTRPPTRIVTVGNQSFYVLGVPFDTRRFGTITLNDPAQDGIDSFELKAASPPTYTLTPTINGMLASVRAIDGAPVSGANVPVAGFTSATRGRVIRVDLAIIPSADDYESWATAIFGNAGLPEAARTADPDGDGLTNEGEFAAGTDPKNAASLLRILALTLDAPQDQVILGWQSISGKSYLIETASSVNGPWFDVGPPVVSSDPITQVNVGSPADVERFYRIRVVP